MKLIKRGDTLKILRNCFCEHYIHELTNYPREGLVEKKLLEGEEVEFKETYWNCYGTYARVLKDGTSYDVALHNVEEFKEVV